MLRVNVHNLHLLLLVDTSCADVNLESGLFGIKALPVCWRWHLDRTWVRGFFSLVFGSLKCKSKISYDIVSLKPTVTLIL